MNERTPREHHGDDPPLKPRAPARRRDGVTCARKAEVSSSSPEADTAEGETRIVSVLLWPIPISACSFAQNRVRRTGAPLRLANYAIKILRITSMTPPRIPHEKVMEEECSVSNSICDELTQIMG